MSLAHLPQFKSDLLTLDANAVYEKYIACDECRGDLDFDVNRLCSEIAAQFRVATKTIKIVGSAKLGFTLRDKKIPIVEAGRGDPAAELEFEHRPRFSPFSINSDIDVAIVSDSLFDDIWTQCFEYWTASNYSDFYWRRGTEFRGYFFRGWMRPDMLPTSRAFPSSAEWFDFFRQKTSERLAGDYAIKAGVYRDDDFLRTYQQIAIKRCAADLKALG